MTTRRHTHLGDSLTAQTSDGVTAMPHGGPGGWVELERLYLDKAGLGPLVSSGLSGVWRGIFPYGGTEWTQIGTWTLTTSADAFDKAPMGLGWYGANGAANINRYTHPRGLPPAIGYYVDWVDYAGAGSNSWSFRKNANAFENHGQTVGTPGDNEYKRFYVLDPLNVGDTLEFRQADAASAAAKCFVVGIHPFYLAPGSDGLYLQNISGGGQTLHAAVFTGSGNRMAWLNDVNLGTGSPLAEKPDSISGMWLNDMTILNNTTTWGTDIDSLQSLCVAAGVLLGFWNQYETDPVLNTPTVQANYRSTTKSKCAAHTPVTPVLDFFDEMNKLGMGGQAVQADRLLACGHLLLQAGNYVHQGAPLHQQMARIALKWLRANFFGGAVGVPAWRPAGAALPTPPTIYKGKIALAAGPHKGWPRKVIV